MTNNQTITDVKNNSDSLKARILDDGENTSYFQSRYHELAFYLSMSSIEVCFDKELKITKVHMVDSKKAHKLKNIYLSIFHPDSNIDSPIDMDFNKVCQNIHKTFHRVSGGKL